MEAYLKALGGQPGKEFLGSGLSDIIAQGSGADEKRGTHTQVDFYSRHRTNWVQGDIHVMSQNEYLTCHRLLRQIARERYDLVAI